MIEALINVTDTRTSCVSTMLLEHNYLTNSVEFS